MGYTAEKMKSVRYKMDVYDEFVEEYNCRKQLYCVENIKLVAQSKGPR